VIARRLVKATDRRFDNFCMNHPAATASRTVATRLSVAALALVAVAACNPLQPPNAGSPGTPGTPGSATTGVQAKTAQSIVDAYGVNIHLTYTTTPYGNVTGIANSLNELGARHVRDRLYVTSPSEWTNINALAKRGIRFDLIMGRPDNQGGTPQQLVDTAATKLPGAVESLEGANEWNLQGRPNWAAELRGHQQAVWRAAKANPATAKLPVLAPALGLKKDYSALGNITGYSSYGNIHNYPGGQLPSTDIATAMADERIDTGNDPIMTTETQYQNALNTTSGHKPTSERAGGIYAPRLLLENYSRGIARMYNYELFDQKADPSKTNIEMNFGLIRSDGTRKPAFAAMSHLLKLLADPGPAFTPGKLGYTIAGAPSDLRQTLVEKRDGRFYLILWRDAKVWDPIARKDLTVAPVNVRVNLGRTASVNTYRPSTQAAAVATVAATTSVTVPMTGQLTVLEIK
jgi:hypothetical protein